MNDQNFKDDNEIAVKALTDPDVFALIMKKYNQPLSRYVRRLTMLSLDEVDILLQDIFIKVYENLNDFDSSLKFSSWIYRIAHNETIDFYRKHKKRIVNENGKDNCDSDSIEDDDSSWIYNMAEEFDFIDELDRQIDAGSVMKILNEMDDEYRNILVLRFMEDKDYNDISDILKKPPGTVATLIHRAKKQFADIAKDMKIKFDKKYE